MITYREHRAQQRKETAAYIEALSNECGSVAEMARKAKITRSQVYKLLEKCKVEAPVFISNAETIKRAKEAAAEAREDDKRKDGALVRKERLDDYALFRFLLKRGPVEKTAQEP